MTIISPEQRWIDRMSGRDRTAGAAALRAAARCAEPLYALAIRARNWMFDQRIRASHRADMPVVSVGNITTGGTGKTPVVCWLAERLRAGGARPAVLARGYKSQQGQLGDEQRLIEARLNRGDVVPVVVRANPDRVVGAADIARAHRDVGVLILDDGFQHRRLRRDFDLVLIDATNPFGFDHLLPRGLLREQLTGLSRADAILVTRASEIEVPELNAVERRIRMFNAFAPIYRCDHVITAFMNPDETSQTTDSLRDRRAFVFCGIANPRSFSGQLRDLGIVEIGCEYFGDHHAYTDADIARVRREAGDDMLITTEKDWVKIVGLAAASGQPPIVRASVALKFRGDDEQQLFEQIRERAEAVRAKE
ncbi:MAG: tetraacyldisaccharide 4'-kinase [Tepidisphaeraceae bacterium]